MPADELDVAIVGAGLAGLSCAARLRALGIRRFAVFEQGEGVGAFWRGNYDRIRLHSPFHDLPDDGGLRRRYGTFLARDELLAYLERYADHHRLGDHVRFSERVTSIGQEGDGWRVRTTRGTFAAARVVVATSYNRVPSVPELPGKASFGGPVLHSREYRNALPFRGQRILVVGSGNSAAEIALDLADGGASHVALWVRGPRHVLSLRKIGLVARVVRFLRLELTPRHLARNHRFTRTHPDFRKELAKKDAFFDRFSIDLSSYGIRKPDEGPATQMYLRGRVAWYDQGTAAAISKGRIEVIDGIRQPIETLVPGGVRFAEREEPFDAIVLGTGFEPGLDVFLEDHDRLLFLNEDMRRRMPKTDGRSRSLEEPTLFFPGFDLTANGGLSLGLWGFEVADTIGADVRHPKEHGDGSS